MKSYKTSHYHPPLPILHNVTRSLRLASPYNSGTVMFFSAVRCLIPLAGRNILCYCCRDPLSNIGYLYVLPRILKSIREIIFSNTNNTVFVHPELVVLDMALHLSQSRTSTFVLYSGMIPNICCIIVCWRGCGFVLLNLGINVTKTTRHYAWLDVAQYWLQWQASILPTRHTRRRASTFWVPWQGRGSFPASERPQMRRQSVFSHDMTG